MSKAEYVLGHFEAELKRLELQSSIQLRRDFCGPSVCNAAWTSSISGPVGDVALAAAEIVGSPGYVLGIDRNPGAIGRARQRSETFAGPGLEFSTTPLSKMESGRTFDVVVGRFVLAFQPDPFAFRRQAAKHVKPGSQATMNNFLFGDGARQYYEIICGGAKAGPGFAGQSAVQTHMTNTRMTDPEVLELRYPVRQKKFSIRRGSGGAGRYPGGRRQR